MGILNTLLRAVTWWNGSTLNTQFYSWRKGIKVGEDNQGNVFYRNADDSKRWVMFNGEAEASRQAWAALSARDQAALRVFLMSLTRNPTLLVE